MSTKPNIATEADVNEVEKAIAANGGQLSRLQATIIANQIKKGVVPHQMICIVSGAAVAVAQRDLREKRLANAEGDTPQEKLFNLLTSYRSLPYREKKAKVAQVQAYKPSRTFGSEFIEGRLGAAKTLIKLQINEATIFTTPDADGKVRRLSIKNGEIVKDETFDNPAPEQAPTASTTETPESTESELPSELKQPAETEQYAMA